MLQYLLDHFVFDDMKLEMLKGDNPKVILMMSLKTFKTKHIPTVNPSNLPA